MLFLLLAACSRNSAPVEETVGETGLELQVGANLVDTDVDPTMCPAMRRGFTIPKLVFYDADRDTFGDPGTGHQSCWMPIGYVGRPGDCDDANAAVNPNATEIGDGVDNNCDGATDETEDTGDTGDTAPVDTGTDTSVDTDGGGIDTVVETGIALTGIQVSWDGSGGSFPAMVYGWPGNTSGSSVVSGDSVANISPTAADLSTHPWVDIQVSWSSGASWSDDCTGFSASSDEYAVALFAKTGTGAYDTCRVYVDGAEPTGGDAGVWVAYP